MEDITKATPPQSPDGFTFDLQRFAFTGGSGTEADPYQIATVADLQQLATDVNGGTTYEGKYFQLTADINLSSVSSWTPIGTESNQFKGTFDGDNKTISGLTIDSTSDYVGLFGYVDTGGTIKNVKLTDVDVTGGNWGTGALIGYSTGGTVENCSVIGGKVTGEDGVGGLIGDNEGTVTGCTVENVSVTATRADGLAYVGGLVAQNNGGTVSGNTVFSTVSGTGDYGIGGIVGYNNSKVTDNYYYSTFEAVGYNNTNGTVSNNTQLYKLTLPGGVTASGDTCFTVDGIAYAVGNITLAAKLGYVYSGTTSAEITADIDLSNLGTASLDTENHYVLADDTKTLATADNTTDYPDLVQVYELTVPDSLTVSGDIVATADGKTYAAGSVTLTAADGYTIQNVSVNGETFDGDTFTVSADTTITADSIKFNNADISKATAVTVGGTTGDFGSNSGVYSITASQQNSTLTGNAKNNTVILEGGGENILTGGVGNDTFKFESGGGIVTDYGIGATKSGDGKTLSAAPGSDVLKVDGKVSGVYFDRDASNKNSANFTAVVTYDSDGDSTADQVVVLKDINKKPTKTGSNPVYQTNDVAAATMKIWDTSGSSGKQAVISAAKLKKLFRDDSELDELIQAKVTYLGDIADGKTPEYNPFTVAASSGGDDGTK